MKKTTPKIHTKFLHFLWEKYNDTHPEDEEDIDTPLPEDEDEDPSPFNKKKRFKPIEIQEEEDEEDFEDIDIDDWEEEPISDEDILEKLIVKYKKLKKLYENKLQRRKRRKPL